jgi:hypothetical protein
VTTETLPRGTFEPKFGKTEARKNAVSLRLTTYLTTRAPSAPRNFGHYDLYPEDGWGMFGNDRWGDCVPVGHDHLVMMHNRVAGREIGMDEAHALSDYSRMTGFTPADPSTDRGTDMQAAASYWRKVGMIDGRGVRHTIGAYAAVGRSAAKLAQAANLFGGVGVGIQVPSSAMEQFNKGEPWSNVGDDDLLGGHYVPMVGRKEGRQVRVRHLGAPAVGDRGLRAQVRGRGHRVLRARDDDRGQEHRRLRHHHSARRSQEGDDGVIRTRRAAKIEPAATRTC